jgi:hypothetical protein
MILCCPVCGSSEYKEPDYTMYDREVLERYLVCPEGHEYTAHYELTEVVEGHDDK